MRVLRSSFRVHKNESSSEGGQTGCIGSMFTEHLADFNILTQLEV